MDRDQVPPPPRPPDFDDARRAPVAFGALLFGFGLAAGFLLAFSGYAVLQDSASLVVTVFLAALFVIALVGSLLVFLRKPLMRRVFGVANAQLERFATPLADVAEAAAARDPQRATASARDLVRLTLARYAWLSTRRWIVAALTGLIAAMAALAGTALLFKQNELLAIQSDLLAEQNIKLEAQSAYLAQDVQLAEAARNAQLAVEITRISEALGEALADSLKDRPAAAPDDWAARIPVLDPATDLPEQLIMRIAATSRAVKPYRFLDPRIRAHDDADKIRIAMQHRRAQLPQAYAAMERFFGWTDPPPDDRLIERPASPERAQLLVAMIGAGIREFEMLNWFGLDLSFAWAPDTDLLGVSMQAAQLSFAVFDRGQIRHSDFRGAALENASFRKCYVGNSRFSGIGATEAKGPFRLDEGEYASFLSGADFRDAMMENVEFGGAHVTAARFDRAVLNGVDFTAASLGSATFRDAVILSADFTGSDLRSVELDGALVFSATFLDDLAAVASPGTFRADRFEIAPDTIETLGEIPTAFANLDGDIVTAITGSDRVWRIRRVMAFEEEPAGTDRAAGD